ncbi:TetR family transcriptional regulator [Paracoccus sp. YIM 132242]|uniref:TetR family transcriptional regulator n=1 Tax=Paracoccus lichenicola TaxID=2665644 RepID=A0A6L6HW47_9RHOB|nr:TetR family transcriptional regulator [Paracoccus lichenicola]MTE01538.1 TetR family transcriptional regulator [Paracoccus lichenicola]
MGRKRTIDRDALMGAVESVARREGVSGLSIDAVAREVGISKSSVVYDCGSKAALLAAFTRHQLCQYRARFDEALQAHAGRPNAWLRAMIDMARDAPTDDDVAITMLISASMGEHAECRDLMRASLAEDAQRVAADAEDRARMLQVLLAVHGLFFLECFGLHRFDEITRQELLDGLVDTLDTDKGASAASSAPSDT